MIQAVLSSVPACYTSQNKTKVQKSRSRLAATKEKKKEIIPVSAALLHHDETRVGDNCLLANRLVKSKKSNQASVCVIWTWVDLKWFMY